MRYLPWRNRRFVLDRALPQMEEWNSVDKCPVDFEWFPEVSCGLRPESVRVTRAYWTLCTFGSAFPPTSVVHRLDFLLEPWQVVAHLRPSGCTLAAVLQNPTLVTWCDVQWVFKNTPLRLALRLLRILGSSVSMPCCLGQERRWDWIRPAYILPVKIVASEDFCRRQVFTYPVFHVFLQVKMSFWLLFLCKKKTQETFIGEHIVWGKTG